MKVKERIPEQGERTNERYLQDRIDLRNNALPWQREIIALADAYLSTCSGNADVVHEMHRRTNAICRMLEDMALGQNESETSLDALAVLMRIAQEQIYVADWIAKGKEGSVF